MTNSLIDAWGWPQWISAVVLLLMFFICFSDDFAEKEIKKPRTVGEFQLSTAASLFFILWLSYAGGFWK